MSIQTLPTPDDTNLQRTVQAIKQLAQGRSNATGTFTLTAGATSTVVTGEYISSDSHIFFTPLTDNAAGAVATTYVALVGNKTFTITHANAATADRAFAFIALG